MVNLGRPSRGCKLCKARRIKCDEARPTCERCAKSGRVCPGYVDDWDLYVRDETASTKNKVIAKDKSQLLQVIASGQGWPPVGAWPFIYCPLSVPPESQAITFCFQSMSAVAQDNETIMRYSDVLPAMYLTAPANSALTHATDALALSVMWKAKRRDDMARCAHFHHLNALKHLASLIGDPVTAYTDETLMTILLLCMYEVMAGNDRGIALHNHVKGAVLITMRRDHFHFHGDQSMMLFRAVRNLLLQNCTLASTSLKELTGDFDWFASDKKNSRPSLDIFNSLCRISSDVADLRSQAKALFSHSSPCSEEDVIKLEVRADALLASMQEWHDNLPPNYSHKTVVALDDQKNDGHRISSFNGIAHVYGSLWEANMMCTGAAQTLFIGGVLLRCRCWQQYHTYTTSDTLLRKLDGFEIMQEAANTICAAVPFCFGDHITNETGHKADDEVAGRGLSFITGPLRAAYITEGIMEEQRLFMRQSLEALAYRFGVDTPRLILNMPPSLIFQCTPDPAV